MTTKTKASLVVTIQDLVAKLVDAKLDHIYSILHYQYDVRITEIITYQDKAFLVFLESEVHNGRGGIMCYNQDYLLQCDVEDEAERIWDLFEGKIIGGIKVSKADLHDFLDKTLDLLEE